MEFLKFFGTIAGGVFSRIAADELKAWVPAAVRRLTSIAIRKLPENQRERFSEEWQSDLGEMPGDFAKLVYAFDLIRAAYKISAEFGSTRRSTSDKIAKRLMDLLVGVFSIVTAIPVALSIAIAVKLDSEGPVFVYHERIGQGGRPFRVRKFRTKYVDGHERLEDHLSRNPYQREMLERSHILLQDPRITRVGRFLRKMSLDELPQMWNVVKGEMSLVGPRPLVRAEIEQHDEHLYCSLKPGITGLWQTSDTKTWRALVELDRAYARFGSVWLDLKILARTVRVVSERELRRRKK
jgi:lipopolysaccharide/colanic/teichoic acid biosynthesis glycosyltransferase